MLDRESMWNTGVEHIRADLRNHISHPNAGTHQKFITFIDEILHPLAEDIIKKITLISSGL